MRSKLLLLCSLAGIAFAQPPAPRPAAVVAAPKNLKVLPADDTLMDTMRAFNESLGVDCNYCHVQGDFPSDSKPQKETARKMIALVRQAEKFFPTTAGVYPRGYHEVDCITCHRGSVKPETKSPKHFLNRRDAMGNNPAMDAAVNLKVLPKGTVVHGHGTIMEDFRDALQVDCAYCHGGGVGQDKDLNPRKEISRQMIVMTRQLNAAFPGTGEYPAGPSAVTCYTCHRLDTHPVSLSNKNYPPVNTPVP
ncbi:MAG: c-type cytochrome [Bryobacteraceae bacterium]